MPAGGISLIPNSILLANWELSSQRREARGAGFGKRDPLQPAHEPEDIGG